MEGLVVGVGLGVAVGAILAYMGWQNWREQARRRRESGNNRTP